MLEFALRHSIIREKFVDGLLENRKTTNPLKTREFYLWYVYNAPTLQISNNFKIIARMIAMMIKS